MEEGEARALVESLLDVKPGMTVEEFRRMRPDARLDLIDADRETGLRADESQTFVEGQKALGDVGPEFTGKYEFKDGRLVDVFVVLGGARSDMRLFVSAILDTCERAFDEPVSAHVFRQIVQGRESRRPILVWRNQEVTLTQVYKADVKQQQSQIVRDYIVLSICSADAEAPLDFPRIELSESLKRDLFRRTMGIELPPQDAE